MITPAYAQLMARYNKWQNESLYGAASDLGDEERRRERGAFFGSIHKTLNHILWGDEAWMSRLAGHPAPPDLGLGKSVNYYDDWEALRAARAKTDAAILGWADAAAPEEFEGDFTWRSGVLKRELTRPRWLLFTHMFNHQTHHRGQVHAMLTAAGARPDDTDIPFMPGLEG